MSEDDLAAAHTDAVGCKDELALLDTEHVATHDSCRIHPARHTDHEDNQHKNTGFWTIKVPQGIAEQQNYDEEQR